MGVKFVYKGLVFKENFKLWGCIADTNFSYIFITFKVNTVTPTV